MRMVVGLDVSLDKIAVCVLAANGSVVWQGKIKPASHLATILQLRAYPAIGSLTSTDRLQKARGWSQLELARRLDVSRQTINAIETGRCDLSLPLAFRFAALFKRRIEEIFFAN